MRSLGTKWARARRIVSRTLVWGLFAAGAVILVGILFLELSPTYHAYVVTGRSMEPAIAKGDLIIVGPASGFLGRPLVPGAVATFKTTDGLVTHRVVGVDGGGLVTRGDAVGHDDPWRVPASEVTGVVLARIPKVGVIPQSLLAAHGLPVAALAVSFAGLFVLLLTGTGTGTVRRRRPCARPVRVDLTRPVGP